MGEQAREQENGLGVGRGSDFSGGQDALLSAILTAALDCVIVMDARGTIVELNPAAERTFGYSREEAVGKEMAALLVPPSLRERHRSALLALRRKGVGCSSILGRRVELTGMRSDASEFPIELTVTQVAQEPAMFAGFVRDITERRRTAEAKDLLAAASAAFDTSLDPVQTMRTIARTAIPKLAELCVIDLIREDGVIGDSVVAAVDERTERRLEELRTRQPLNMNGLHPVARALRSRTTVVIDDLSDPEALDEVAQSDEHRQLMLQAGYQSAVVMTLTARGRLLGTLSFLHMRGDAHRYDPVHLPLMQELASRAAMALDNANMYAERARVARTLQRSLLPEGLPPVRGVQLASAYRPVGEGSEVGGDFYDVFELPSGCWLVVGDVCGKGTEAAAVTALVRHSIRALAFTQSSPAQVLRSLNEVMLSHELSGRFATAIVARLDLSEQPVRAVIAGAGHPPPVLLDARGLACNPEVHGPLLGVLDEIEPLEVEVKLDPGAALILYTDGLPDAGAPKRALSFDEICRHVAGQSDIGPQALVRCLEDLAVSRSAGKLRDDIAILAARVEP
jgi:PAS domain S-box-containing protein